MKVLGLDIGTTTISAVVYEAGTGVLTAKTVASESFIPGESWEKIQDPHIIYEKAMASVQQMLDLHPDIQAIGVTGQMHGIVYLDEAGDPVSPLYIWQDGRGDLPCGDTTWAGRLSQITGYEVATGYGMVTHYYNLNHGLVHENAAVFCTIHDYLAMKLAGLTRPLTEPTDAASLGLFDGPKGCFDPKALEAAGIDDALVPGLITEPCAAPGAESGQLYLLWGKSMEEDLSHYLLYRGEEPGFLPGEENLIAKVLPEEYRVSRYVDEGLKEHRQYFYRICAVNQEGEKGPMSQEFSAFTREPLWQKET